MKVKYYALISPLLFSAFFLACGSGQYTLKNEPVNKDSLKAVKAANFKYTQKDFTERHIPVLYRVRTTPVFTLQINGNFNYGLGELALAYDPVFEADQLLTGQNFGVTTGFGGFVMGKFPLENSGNIRLTFTGAFNYFKNNNLNSQVQTRGKVSYNVASIGAGIENSFTPSYKVKPYIAVSLMANLIWGEANNIVNPDSSTSNFNFKKTFRIGYIISSGIEFLISNRIGLNIGLSLVDANRLLKSSKTSDNPNEFTLRDKKDTDNTPALPLSGYKQFLYTTFYLGVNLYFGINNKLYKL
jgi:hypothetical protein